MIQTYIFKVVGVGDIPISATSWQEAQEILQAYIDKRSLDWIISYE